jgi:NAD(P)-dependent dehydrogenase (short-subunit alcohol dehydrogenase family)
MTAREHALITRTFRLGHDHVRRFADASGDLNPLHLDKEFARATPYGRCICHGALVSIAALAAAETPVLRQVEQIHLQFKQPVFPDESYAIRAERGAERTHIEVSGRGKPAVAITLVADAAGPPLRAVRAADGPLDLRGSAREWTLEEVAAAGPFRERYACRLDLLSALARELGAGDVPDVILLWLAAASYTVGMVAPGRDALFAGARIQRASAAPVGALTASVSAVDDRTGLVAIDASLDHGNASATLALQTFLRPPVPTPDRSSIAQYLTPSTALSGRNVLVVGGSRGLGAALTGALATQQATVWAGFARSAGHAERLRAEFGPDHVRLLQFDAEDVQQTRTALARLREEVDMLDGIALCAAPPLFETALNPEAAEPVLRFLHSSVALAVVPLVEAVEALAPGGWLAVMSSSALEDPPDGWPHYVIAKAALEGVATYCARRTRARVLVVRAAKMLTDSTNTPLGRLDAIPAEKVAAAITRWAMSEAPAGEVQLLSPQDVTGMLAAAEAPPP